MAEKIELELVLKEAFQKAQGMTSELQKGGAFASEKGAKAYTKLQGLLSAFESLSKQTNLTKEEFSQLRNLTKDIFGIISGYAKNLGSVSEKTQALQKAFDSATDALNKQKDKLAAVKTTKQSLMKDLGDVAKNVEIQGLKSGRHYTLKNIDTIREYYKQDPSSLSFSGSAEDVNKIKTLLSQLETTDKTIAKQEAKIDQAQIKVDQAQLDLQASIQQDAITGGGRGAELIQESTIAATTTSAAINAEETAKARAEEKVATDEVNKSLESFNNTTEKQTTSLGKAFKQFSIYAVLLRSIKTAAREAVQTIKQLDSSLTEQAMVTGKTREQTYALLSTYQDLAAQTGATTKEIAGLATQFMRQGKTTQDALTLTRAAMDAAKVAGISASDSVNYLTTALNGFQMSAKDAMKVSDKFAAIAASSATSYDEIATALSKVASQANLAGMSIDYTTALLAKGLETTREAPETMGTALKTIIARMREIGDYGETLTGDTDLNNVETQLAYVGIALKDNNGELRSTEDVLDDLGRKWDTLNSNQQAAVAKALAGTRQQSRLIAMMTDYERVLELQEISERSQGATLAQMATYLEGMDAALNKVNVAWEKIVTSITDSDVIINIITITSDFLDKLGSFLSTDWGLNIALTGILSSVIQIVAKKTQEYIISKQQQKLEEEQRINELKGLKIAQQLLIESKKETAEERKQVALEALKNRLEQKQISTIEYTSALQAIENNYNKDIAVLKTEQVQVDEQLALLGESRLSTTIATAGAVATVSGGIMSALTGSQAWLTTLTGVGIAMQMLPPLIRAVQFEMAKLNTTSVKEALASMASNAAKNLGLPGLLVAGGLLATAGIAGISSVISKYGKNTQNTSEQVNELSNEIYKLENKARALNNITSSYKDLDNQIIKTKKDQEEMNELLAQAGDKLSDKEKQAYDSLITNEQKYQYLLNITEKAEEEANKKRVKQLEIINSLTAKRRALLLDEATTNSEYLTAQAALYAINNSNLYNYIDGLEKTTKYTKEQRLAIQELTQAMIEQLSVAEALNYANNADKIKSLVDTIATLTIETKNLNNETKTFNIAEILTSDDFDIQDKITAYREGIQNLNDENKELFLQLYSDIATISQLDNSTIKWIDDMHISLSAINDIGDAIQALGYSTDKATEQIDKLFTALQTGDDIQSALVSLFNLDLETEEGQQTYNKLLKAYADATGTGILNMGQNIDKLTNQINSFYEKAQKWTSMSASERADFLSDNAALFEGNKQLYEALTSGDYNKLYEALADTEGTLYKNVQQQIKDIDTEIANEEAKLAEQRDEAYITQLKEWKAYLQDTNKFYAASLDIRLKQEQTYLDEYKNYLKSQQDALTDSLEKRRDAYQKYFDAINQEQQDEDFEEKENTLIANLTKLASSTDASSMAQMSKMESELAQLEKERIQELRERAQESIMQSMDNELEEINKKFDKLLESNQALLQAMTGDLQDPLGFLTRTIGSKLLTEGLTNLQLEDYVRNLQSTYGSLNQFAGIDWNSLGNILNTLNLNVNGTTINNLSSEEQQSIYEAIMTALTQVGLR